MSLPSGLLERHRTALSEALAFVHGRYEPWGIVVSGSIVRGDPDPSSDLDLYVLHDAPWRQRVQRRFNGVPTEIFVNPEATVLGYFEEEARDGQPYTAHMLTTGVVLLATDEARMEELLRRARACLEARPEWTDLELVRSRYEPACLVEDAVDKRDSDPELAMRLLGMGMEGAVSHWFKSRSSYQPRHKEVLAAVEAGDAELGRLPIQTG